MTQLINWLLGRNTDHSTPSPERDMREVMRRVDQQIGRAVERLSDR